MGVETKNPGDDHDDRRRDPPGQRRSHHALFRCCAASARATGFAVASVPALLVFRSAAAALSPRLVVGRNRLRDVFLDPAEQDLYPAWVEVTAQLVAGFRSSVGVDMDDERFVDLVGSLSIASPRFRELWGRQDVVRREGVMMSIAHPVVGELALYREKLPVSGTDGQMLAIYHPEPGSSDADKLSLLISSDFSVSSTSPTQSYAEEHQ